MRGMSTTPQDFQSWYRLSMLSSADDAGWPKAMIREVTKAKDK
jgi:hypothetical protein